LLKVIVFIFHNLGKVLISRTGVFHNKKHCVVLRNNIVAVTCNRSMTSTTLSCLRIVFRPSEVHSRCCRRIWTLRACWRTGDGIRERRWHIRRTLATKSSYSGAITFGGHWNHFGASSSG